MSEPLRIAALVSGGGRTMVNLAEHIERGELEAVIALVIASRADLPAVKIARDRALETMIAPGAVGSEQRHDAIAAALASQRVDLVCLCGYLHWFRVDPELTGRVINIHPALLPDFGGPGMYGMRVHRAVLASGRPYSGCTVHYVDEDYDRGPIILQRVCPVLPGDDEHALAARVFELECEAYPRAIGLVAGGQKVESRK